VVTDHAPYHDPGLRKIRAAISDFETNPTIIYHQFAAGAQGGKNFGVEQWRPVLCARRFVHIESKISLLGKTGIAFPEFAKPELGALDIHEYTQWPVYLAFEIADDLHPAAMIFMTSMAEIEPENISACVKKRWDCFPIRAGRPKGCDNFCFTVSAHNSVPD
jgi:hypothetical protein